MDSFIKEKTILLVEDNNDDEALTLRAIRKNNFDSTVTVMRDGEDALAYLLGDTAWANPLPAVVLLDLQLPKISGLNVLEKLREAKRTRHLPVVVLTSSDMEEGINMAYRLGCNSFIQKPIDFHRFIDEVGQISQYWTHLNIHPIYSIPN